MAYQWIKTSYPGIRYREHPTRKHGVQKDRYFAIRYKLGGRDKEEACGWASEGMTLQKAAERLAELRENQRTGSGPVTLEEKRALAEEKRRTEAEERERQERDKLAFGKFFTDTYLPQQRADHKSPGSLRREEELFRLWIAPAISQKTLRAVSPLDLERIKKAMSEAGLAARTIHYCLAIVRQVFNHARRLGLYEGEPPTSKVKMPVEDNRRQRFLTHQEADMLLAALAERSQDVHGMAVLALHCGLRAGEVFALEWGDVDLGRGVLTIRGTNRKAGTTTKSGKTRQAFMTEGVRGMLTGRERGGHHDLVFPGRDGQRVKSVSATFDRTVAALGLNAGIEDDRQKICFHGLRHTFASWLVEQGVDLFVVKELMGHSVLAMTERYSHLAPDTLRLAVGKLDESIKRGREAEVQGKIIPLRGAREG